MHLFLCILRMKMKSESVSLSVKSDSTTPWTVGLRTPLSIEFSRKDYWNEQPFPSPGDLPNSGIKLRSLALQADSLPLEPPRKHILRIVMNSLFIVDIFCLLFSFQLCLQYVFNYKVKFTKIFLLITAITVTYPHLNILLNFHKNLLKHQIPVRIQQN